MYNLDLMRFYLEEGTTLEDLYDNLSIISDITFDELCTIVDNYEKAGYIYYGKGRYYLEQIKEHENFDAAKKVHVNEYGNFYVLHNNLKYPIASSEFVGDYHAGDVVQVTMFDDCAYIRNIFTHFNDEPKDDSFKITKALKVDIFEILNNVNSVKEILKYLPNTHNMDLRKLREVLRTLDSDRQIFSFKGEYFNMSPDIMYKRVFISKKNKLCIEHNNKTFVIDNNLYESYINIYNISKNDEILCSLEGYNLTIYKHISKNKYHNNKPTTQYSRKRKK